MSDEDITYYKIIVYPFTKQDAQLIRNYLTAFDKNRTVEIEGVKNE